MKRTFLLIAALLATATVASDIHASVRAQFEAFKAKFNKQYPNKEAESKRFQIFVSNMIKAKKMHELNPLASFGVNEYSDLSEQEFTRYHNAREHYARRPRTNPEPLPLKSSAGEKIDWRAKGAVTAVKNQGQCGSCWAFSATGNIEGQHFIKHGQLVSLSEQELVSCDTLCDACQGGLMDYAFEWLVSSRGGNIFTEASYPYASGNGNSPSCKLTGHTVGAKISGHRDIAHSETAIADEVYSNGPVSIGVDATSWQTYNGGILTNCISSQVDHGVLAVGFDDTHSPAYWIIKNSWGASWGEEGYIRVAKGSNQCLIDYAPSTSISA